MTRPDYGLDAPGVVRNLALASVAGFTVYALAVARIWSGTVQLGSVAIDFSSPGLGIGLACGCMAVYMFWSSKSGKVKEREVLLDHVPWNGAERVLDVGCGRGLLLVGAAKRLTTGSAVGVDIWQAQDLGGNGPAGALENARIEGVSARVRVETADMRKLPFPDGSFDVIVTKAAVHNLYQRADRATAMKEFLRVLAPGGTVVIDDIRHLGEYAAELRAGGLEVRRIGSRALAMMLTVLSMGSLRVGRLVARKP